MAIFGKSISRIKEAAGTAPAAAAAFSLASPWSDSGNLEKATLAHLYADTAMGNHSPVVRSDAMSLAAVAKARNIITGTISRFPMVIMQGTTPHDNPAAWAEQPEPARSRSQTILWTVDSLIFYGRAFWLITDRYADGAPRRFAMVPEHKATVDENGNLIAAFDLPVTGNQYIRFDAPHEGVLNFGSRILRKALDTERAAENAAANPVPSIELHQVDGDDLTVEEVQELLAQWRTSRSARGGGVGFTNRTLEVKTHGQPAEQLLIDAQNQAAIGIARMMGLPAWAVDAVVAGSSLNYSNNSARARELIDFGLYPYMSAITDRLSMDDVLRHGTWVRFEESEFISPSLKERLEAYKIAIEAGIYTAEEARNLIDGIPLESRTRNDQGPNNETGERASSLPDQPQQEDHRREDCSL